MTKTDEMTAYFLENQSKKTGNLINELMDLRLSPVSGDLYEQIVRQKKIAIVTELLNEVTNGITQKRDTLPERAKVKSLKSIIK